MSFVDYVWPPSEPVTVQNFIDSYLYREYNDDEDCQALVSAYNDIGQSYLEFFNSLNLPIYTGLTGALLDWVGQGVYGYPRPSLPSGMTQAAIGPLNTYAFNQLPLNTYQTAIAFSALFGIGYFAIGVSPIGGGFYAASDDVYQRCLTWHFYKGDGFQFNVRWLKRRIYRFLFGFNGTDPGVTTTEGISVTFSSLGEVTINLGNSGAPAELLAVFAAAVAAGVLQLPFQFTWSVVSTAPALIGTTEGDVIGTTEGQVVGIST